MYATRDPILPTLSFFADSSSKDQDYMVLGGFAVRGTRVNEIENRIAELRLSAGIQSEFHWSGYRGGRREQAYKDLVNYGFELIKDKKAALHVAVTRFDKFDHKRGRDGAIAIKSRDTSVNKVYYQLSLHRIARYYGKLCAIHIRLDQGNDSSEVVAIRGGICADAYSRYRTRPNCIRSMEGMNSCASGIIQMSDVIIGGVAAHLNDRQLNKPKSVLRDHILEVSNVDCWKTNTHSNARFFTIWNVKVD